MKISDLRRGPGGLPGIDGPGREKDGEARRADFNDQLIKAQTTETRKQLDKLIKDIEVQGQRLANHRTLVELKRYKEMVRNFLREVVSSGYQVREETGWDRRGRYKVHVLVDKVNAKLEELTEEILQKEKSQVEILARVDEIRGLLVDMYT
ncbi:hypothetical protein CTH_0017 [Carboxydocella thermautotrophica]|nr:hypothetical protein CTH_0017 [Carboxydocella thermautotrophica]